MSAYNLRKSKIFNDIEYYKNQKELTKYLDSISKYLGYILIEFNCLEDEITDMICDLTKNENDDVTFIFISELMFRKKFTALFNLYYLKNKKNKLNYESELKNIEKNIDECIKERNNYVHGYWLRTSPKKGVCVKIKLKNKKVTPIYRKIELLDLKEFLNKITSTRSHLLHFHNRFIQEN